jgi:1,4-alpha-glucan branching enzyme
VATRLATRPIVSQPDFATLAARPSGAGLASRSTVVPASVVLAALIAAPSAGAEMAPPHPEIAVASPRRSPPSLRPSAQPGFGAIPNATGTSFRLWAPGVQEVHVLGPFSEWQPGLKLLREPDGVFAAHVPGVTPGTSYRYLLHGNGKWLERHDPRGAVIAGPNNRVYDHASFRWSDQGFRPQPRVGQVIVQLPLRVTAGGTIRDAEIFLPLLADAGATAVLLSPFHHTPGTHSYGYNPDSLFAPSEQVGTPDEVKHFVNLAHGLGLAVFGDFVANHFGNGDGQDHMDLRKFTGRGHLYFKHKTAWGPRPDFANPGVYSYIRDGAALGLKDYHFDGWRWDATYEVHAHDGVPDAAGAALLAASNRDAHAMALPKLTIAEDHRNNPWITDRNGAGFDVQYGSAQFYGEILPQITTPDDTGRDLFAIRRALEHNFNGDPFQRLLYSMNHDEGAAFNGNRLLPDKISPASPEDYWARKRSLLFDGLVLTAAGVPQLFISALLYQTGSWDKQNLTPARRDQFLQIFEFYRDLIALRRNLQGTTAGLLGNSTHVFHQNDADKVIAFHRWDRGAGSDDVIVVANFSHRTFPHYRIGLPFAGPWKVRMNSDSKVYSSDFGTTDSQDVVTSAQGQDGFGLSGEVALGPYSLLVLSRDAGGGA